MNNGNITNNMTVEVPKDDKVSRKIIRDDYNEKKENTVTMIRAVPFLKLFSFADPKDIFLMVVGTIADFANGWSMPLLTILFGKLINTFGQSTGPSTQSLLRQVSKVCACILKLLNMLSF
ncbi:hypothetical protein MKX01_010014 [Papaver californicum]|nr:hypothetical protein MKX01_010014 [Papaver californicum]